MTVDRNILPGMKPTRHSFRCGQPLGPGVAHHGMRNLTHSEPLLKQLNLLKVEDILKLQQLKFYHKLINRQLPGYFTCFPITPATEIHQHSTRAASKLFITRANHEFAKKSLRHSIIVTVNNTITSITNKTLTHSLDGFAKYVKKSIIQSYQSNCSINNCYVCSSLDP